MINEYHFGSITINGKKYNYDVEVRWTLLDSKHLTGQAEVLKWWRKESHIINIDDVKGSIKQKPEVIVIGTGESGVAKVTEDAQKEVNLKGIKLIIDKTGEAIKTFNILKEREKKVIGLFHLTC